MGKRDVLNNQGTDPLVQEPFPRGNMSFLRDLCLKMVGKTMALIFKYTSSVIPKFLIFSLSYPPGRFYKMLQDEEGWASLGEVQ